MASTSLDPKTSAPTTYERHENARPAHIGRVYILGVIMLLFVALLSFSFINRGMEDFQTTDQKRVLEREKILADRLSEDSKLLNDAPSWFKKDQKLIRVPISMAMEMTVKDLAKIKPHVTDVPVTAQNPQGAPTAPDKGAASLSGGQANPPASQPVPAASPALKPAASPAASATPAGAIASGSAGPGTAPGGALLPSATPTPAASAAPAVHPTAPAPSAAPVSPGPAASASPTPTQGASPAAPSTPAPSPTSHTLDPSQPGVTPGGTPQ